MSISNHLQQILDLFAKSEVIIVGDSPLLSQVDVEDACGEEDNEVVRASWHDAEGLLYSVIFTEGGLEKSIWRDGKLVAEDNEGNKTEVNFFDLQRKDANDGQQKSTLPAPAVSLLLQIEDHILSVANLYDELTTSDLQGLAGAKARLIFNLVANSK